MSRKKKGKPAAPAGHGPVAQAGEADKGVGAARYKEAIEHFKELLKRERRPEWLAGLAAAYAGRAEQLAAKDMVKEALALWRTRADACGVPLLGGSGGSGGPYVSWLLKCGKVSARGMA